VAGYGEGGSSVNTFDRALEVLDTRGWTKVPEAAGSGTNLCLGLAMLAAGANTQDYDVLRHVVTERYPDRVCEYSPYPYFNDHPDTTEEDVRLVLKLASGKAGELA
jgi:hypothetical protein